MLSQYARDVSGTDVLESTDIRSVQHGLFGEVGGIMSAAKKHVRDGNLFPEYRRAAEEEFGDTLWYLAALCRRRGVALEAILDGALALGSESLRSTLGGSDPSQCPEIAGAISASLDIDDRLASLGHSAADLLGEAPTEESLRRFALRYLEALLATGLTLSRVAESNLKKARGAFLNPKLEELINFDATFDEEERLPSHFRFRIDQRASGKSYLRWNGVFIGAPLTDNIVDSDGYRFHDVFHLANAAVLHWSPVVRALIKQKRKSSKEHDEQQDGGRAIVVEEGLTAWLFSRAKLLNYFEGQKRVPLGILKVVKEFVTGYEVEQCPLKLWEGSILQGFAVFRQVRDAQGGYVVGNREKRTLQYEPLGVQR